MKIIALIRNQCSQAELAYMHLCIESNRHVNYSQVQRRCQKVILRLRMMCNSLHLTDKGKNLCKPAYKFLSEQSERKSMQMLTSPGKDHVYLLATPFQPAFS